MATHVFECVTFLLAYELWTVLGKIDYGGVDCCPLVLSSLPLHSCHGSYVLAFVPHLEGKLD